MIVLKPIRKRKFSETLIKIVLFCFCSVSVLITLSILLILIMKSSMFFGKVSPAEFFFSTKWTPLLMPKHYGVLPILSGTFLIVFFSCLLSLPLGLMCAVYLSEYCNKKLRRCLKPILELLAGVPSIVYGYFALTSVTPILKAILPNTEIYNALSAAIAVGIMTIPMVLSLSEDAMQAVPSSLRESAYALGMTKLEVTTGVVIPAALSGILSSFVLAISRAIGETMIVALAAGSTPLLTANPLQSVQTMTGYIVQVATGDAPKGSIEEETLYVVATLLFLITLGMNVLSSHISKKFREDY